MCSSDLEPWLQLTSGNVQLQVVMVGFGKSHGFGAGHSGTPRVSVSRSIFALMNDTDRMYFGRGGKESDQVGFIAQTRSIFGRSYADEPDRLVEQLRGDEAIAEADTLLLTIPNSLGVAYNTHALDAILTHVAPALGWR